MATAPVFNPDDFEALSPPTIPLADVDNGSGVPTFNPENFIPSGLPNEKILNEDNGSVYEAPFGTMARISDLATRGFRRGDIETQISKLNWELFIGNDTPFINESIAQLRESSPKPMETQNFFEDMVRGSSEVIPFMKDILQKSALRAGQGGIGFGTAGLAFMGVGAIPGFFGGLKAGAITGMAEQTFILEVGELYGEIKEFTDINGKKIEPMAARIGAVMGGAASASLEFVPIALIAKLVPGSENVIGKLATKGLQFLRIPTGKTAFRKFLFNISTLVAAEASAEGGQEFAKIAAGEVTKLFAEGEFEPISTTEALDRVGDAVVGALTAMPLIAVGFSAPRLAVDVAQDRRANNIPPNPKGELLKDVTNKTIDSVTAKLREAPVSPDLKTYQVSNLNAQEKEALAKVGVEIADNGVIVAEDAELIAAESMRRTDFYQKQFAEQNKVADKGEAAALRKVARGRIREIDKVVDTLDQRIVDTMETIDVRKAEGKPVKALDNRVNSLLKTREILDEERANLLTASTPLAKTREALKALDKPVELKGVELLRAERRTAKARARALEKGVREGLRLAKTDVKAAQSAVIDVINQSDLKPEDKAKFLIAIRNVQTAEQFQRALPKLQNRINKLVTAARREKVTAKLKRVLKRTVVKGHKGKFGPDVQKVLDVAREAFSLTKDAAIQRLKIRAGNGTTDIPTPVEALENRLLAAKADPTSVDVAQLEQLLDTVTSLIEEGKSILAGDVLAKQEESAAQRTELLSLIGAERVETPQQRNRREKVTKVEVEMFIGPSGAWWNKLRRVMRSSDKARVDAMTNKLTLFDENRAFDRGKKSSVERFTELMLRAMNTTSERALLKQLQIDETVELNLGAYLHSDGVVRNIEVRTRAQLRKRMMELKAPDLRLSMKSEKSNAYTDEIITALEDQMTELDWRMVNAQLEFYEGYYQRINEVYERVYGYSLPKLEFYSPIKRRTDDTGTQDEFMKGILYRGGVAPGSLKNREPTVRPISEIGDFTAMQSHISEMEYFIAYSEKTQQLNQVVGHPDVLQRIERAHGKDLLKTIRRDLDMFSKRGVQNSITGTQIFETLMRNFSFAQLGLKPQIGLKQLASFAAFAEDVKSKDFVEGMVKFAANPRAALRELNESEFFRNRGLNIDRDYQAILTDKSFFNVVGKRPTITKMIMVYIRFGDKAAIALGGYGHYHARLKQNGGDKAAALENVERLSVNTQQSPDVDQLSEWQRQNVFTRIMTQFMSSANALARAEYAAIVDNSYGRLSRKEFAKRMFVLHIFIPNMIQFVANGFNWENEDQLRASILGSLNGVFAFGTAIDTISRLVVSGTDAVHDLSNRNPLDFIVDMGLAIADFAKNGISAEDWLDGSRALDLALQSISAVTGAPVKTVVSEVRGAIHISDGVNYGSVDDIIRGLAEVTGYSTYIIDEKILAQ